MSTFNLVESPLDPKSAVYDAIVNAGDPWIHEIRKGQVFRILDLEGNQAVDTLFYNAHDPEERYSAADTVRAQGALYLTTGTQLMSTEGRVMLTIVADTCGRHDTLGGACAAESNTVRYALAEEVHAQLPRQLPDRVATRRHRPGQARPSAQHQLLHERAGHRKRAN
jgi:uncharacterized protein